MTFLHQYTSDKALPCPFCGGLPILVPWHGGPKSKRHVMCRNDNCFVTPSTCGRTERLAVKAWNSRARSRVEIELRNVVFNTEQNRTALYTSDRVAKLLREVLLMKAGERP